MRQAQRPSWHALEQRTLFSSPPVSVGSQVNISNTPGDQSEGPAITVNGGKVQAVWGERSSQQVRFRELDVAAGAWSATDVFADGTDAKFQWPDVAPGLNGATHVVYPASNSSTSDPVYARNRASGSSWSGTFLVGTDNYANPARLASAPDGTLWAVWRDADGTAVRWRRSTDGGVTWPSGGNVATQGGNMFSPDIAVGPDGVPHVVWNRRSSSFNNNTIYWADWNGSGWTTGTIGNQGNYTCDAAIVVGADNVQHLVCRTQSGSGWTLKYLSRSPGGSWANGPDVFTTGGDVAYVPAIAVDAANGVHVTFNERSGSVSKVWYSAKQPGAAAWSSRIGFSTQNNWDSRTAVVTTPDPAANGSGANLTHIIYQRGGPSADTDDIYYQQFRTDYVAPTVDVIDVTPAPRTTAIPSATIAFSEPVTGFDPSDVQLTRDGVSVSLAGVTISTTDNKTFTLNNLTAATTAQGTYVLTAAVAGAGAGVTDAFANNPTTNASDTWVVTAPNVAPTVTNVFINSTNWTTAYRNSLVTSGEGDATHGYRVKSFEQGRTVAWTNLNQVSIRFSENVNINAGDLALSGINAVYGLAPLNSFAYDPVTFTATWTFNRTIPSDKVTITLEDNVTDASGAALDGEWNNPTFPSWFGDVFPSGNGTAGGDFVFSFRVLPGDVNRDGMVGVYDYNILRANLTQLNKGVHGGDLDGDGLVSIIDYSYWRANLNQTAPA